MAGNTKNVGQVSGVYIGSTPPENIIMIWYDNTPSQMVHKVYNPGLSQWVVLDQNLISSITYSELVNIATNVGLTVGQWFKITDKSNALALAVTSTKVQYSDSLGNILIDDLGSNIQYHVSSSNLSIDDVVGVFDEVNKKLVFQFSEQVPDYTADDYILGKVKRNNVWSLAKFKLSSFLSKVTGNSITWNGGFFFNFSSAISNILDKKGGVVSKDTYDIDKQNIATDIQNVGKENQTIIENVNNAITNATSSTAIYDKQTPAVATGGEPTDVATGDKLITIVSKFQRYINKFKFATGIRISKNYSSTDSVGQPNNNDTVETAIEKLHRMFSEIKLSLPSDFTPNGSPNEILDPLDDFITAFAKIEADRRQIHSIETVKTSVAFESGLGSGISSIKFRIHNGSLQMYLLEDNMLIQWIYTRTDVNDKYVFFPIGFSDDLVNKLSVFLENPYEATSVVILNDVSVISPTHLINEGSGEWGIPTKLILARLSFGYRINTYDNKLQFGFVLTPISNYYSDLITDSSNSYTLQSKAIGSNNDATFQGFLAGGYRFYLPKLLVQYKFC